MAVNLDDNECFTNFVTWMDNNFSSIVVPQMLSKGEVATTLIEQHYSLEQNQSKKKLLEQVASNTDFDLMYPPSVMTCSLCFANCTNIYIGKCPKCGGKTIRKHLEKPTKEIKFINMDPISVIPHEYLFVVGRNTNGRTMDTFHRFRAEGFYYKYLDNQQLINFEFRQKFVATFDAHADARCAISEMHKCCKKSPNQPIANLLDVMISKYYPGSRLTILMIHPANFCISPFHFANFILDAEKLGIPRNSIGFFCYGLELTKTTVPVTVPCNTFFTGEEFVMAIEETREKELIQQVTPTVHGYLTTMLNESLSRNHRGLYPAPKGGRSKTMEDIDINNDCLFN